MKRPLQKLLLIASIVAIVGGCSPNNQPQNSIYHWKTTFAPDSTELDFLHKHNIGRIYLRMFDVAVEQNHTLGTTEIVPIATTKFATPMPSGVEIVPTVYITIDALRTMAGKEAEFAMLIVERALAMCSYNECGKIGEMQLDCDWTSSTKQSFEALCRTAREVLNEQDVDLSITVRLHQLSESAPPADRCVLMLYNTGAIKNPATKNSILDIEDAKPYLKKGRYPIPLAYAYPAFGWGVKFKDGKFSAITSGRATPAEGETIRIERPTASEILAVKGLAEEQLGKPSRGNILYHLDNQQLKHYTDDEIAQILAH